MEDLRTRALEVLAESSRLLTATLDLGEVLDRLAEIARRRLEVDVVRIWLPDESGEFLSLRTQQGARCAASPRERTGFFSASRFPAGCSRTGCRSCSRMRDTIPGS